MARIRSIKPDTASSASLNRCSVEAELLFIKSWCFFDDTGVFVADPLQLKMRVYPGRDFSEQQIQAWVDELIAQDCLALFVVPPSDDPALKHYVRQKFWICVNWHHQQIQHPTPARAPIRELWRESLGESDPGKVSFSRAAVAVPMNGGPMNGHAHTADTAAGQDATWRQALRLANESFGAFRMAENSQDRNLALKICYLSITGRLRDDWLNEAVKAMRKAQAKAKDDKPFKPGAFLTVTYKNKCNEARPPLDFRRLLAECAEPPGKGTMPVVPARSAIIEPPIVVDTAAIAAAATKPPPVERKPPPPKPAPPVVKPPQKRLSREELTEQIEEAKRLDAQ